MVEVKKQKVENLDPWESPKETWQYVTIPDEDPLGFKYPTISLNKTLFHAGESYQVPPPVAAYVNERIKVYNRSCVRQLQSNVDRKSLQEVAVGSASPVAPNYVDASQIKTV